MQDKLNTLFLYINFTFVSGVIISGMVLKSIIESNENFLSFLNVKAAKSKDHTPLLGGLSLSVTCILTFLTSYIFLKEILPPNETKILVMSIIPVLIITVYGFIDDKHEIRARHKLILQTISLASIIFTLSNYHQNTSLFYFAFEFILGFALINGMNLVDGIDGLFAKIGLVISTGALYLSFECNSIASIIISCITISSLIAFLHYNKEPAKIYTGEIGGSLLGMIFFIQANLIYERNINLNSSLNGFNEALKIVAIFAFPIVELGITFLRRLLSLKSPFRGDHLHLHHIVKTKFQFTATNTASLISSSLFVFNIFIIATTYFQKPIITFATSVVLNCGHYLLICNKHWRLAKNSAKSKSVFMELYQKPILVIDSKSIDQLYDSVTNSNSNDVQSDKVA